MHWCLAKTVAAVLWGFTVLLLLAALLCCTTVGYKMGEQRAAYRHRELGKSASRIESKSSTESKRSSRTERSESRMQAKSTSIVQTAVV